MLYKYLWVAVPIHKNSKKGGAYKSMIRVGYQGLVNSFCHKAAEEFTKEYMYDVELIPLKNSCKVVEELKEFHIDYGVMAIRNSLAGDVLETAIALRGNAIKIKDIIELEINHCLFVKGDVCVDSVRNVYSHIQSLSQCKRNLMVKTKGVWQHEVACSSEAAESLSNSAYDVTNSAVICRREAGEALGLKLLVEHMEDDINNKTSFGLFKI